MWLQILGYSPLISLKRKFAHVVETNVGRDKANTTKRVYDDQPI